MSGGFGASKTGSSRSKQYAMDPEAIKRMETAERWLNEMRDKEYAYGDEFFRPYEREMVASNSRLLPQNESLMSERLGQGITDIRESAPIRQELRTQQMEGLKLSRPAMINFFEQAINGIDVGKRKGEAVADVEHAFSKMLPQFEQNLSRRGLTAKSSDFRKIGIDKARTKAGASNFAGTQAEAEKFGRLGQALNTRQLFTQPSLDNTAYAQGELQTGGYSLANPADRALNAAGLGVQANAAGMTPLTRSVKDAGYSWSTSGGR